MDIPEMIGSMASIKSAIATSWLPALTIALTTVAIVGVVYTFTFIAQSIRTGDQI